MKIEVASADRVDTFKGLTLLVELVIAKTMLLFLHALTLFCKIYATDTFLVEWISEVDLLNKHEVLIFYRCLNSPFNLSTATRVF